MPATCDVWTMLRADGLVKTFDRGRVRPVDRVSITIPRGRRLGLTGPSGCGKSTLATMLALLLEPDEGTVRVDGRRVDRFGIRAPAALRRSVQLLWQSPVAAADPRMRLRDLIAEPSVVDPTAGGPLVDELAHRVGLSTTLFDRFPHEVSGGQLQRACIARALACRPGFLIADEPTSMLDASSQATVLHALAAAQESEGMGILLITHDTVLARHFCDEVLAYADLQDPGAGSGPE